VAETLALRLDGVTKRFLAGKRKTPIEALRNVGFSLPAGRLLGLVGPDGAGKTTLLRILATLLRPSAGEVRVLGCALPAEAWKLRGRIGLLGHEPLLYRDLSGRENLRFHARLHGLRGEPAEARIAALLAAVEMDRRADERVAGLSAGMRQRIAVCRCVLHEPELLLLDEPDSHLDAEGRELVGELIGPGGGCSRVVVSHDPERAMAEADQVLRLGAGGRVLVA
jgi:heme exporter protein A